MLRTSADLEKSPTPLESAVSSFEKLFKSTRLRAEHSKDIPLCWSGGLTNLSAQPPVLYSDPDHAISSWRTWAMSAYNEHLEQTSPAPSLVLEWVQRPELIEYQITIADKIGRHRMVNNRWAVKSQFQVENA